MTMSTSEGRGLTSGLPHTEEGRAKDSRDLGEQVPFELGLGR